MGFIENILFCILFVFTFILFIFFILSLKGKELWAEPSNRIYFYISGCFFILFPNMFHLMSQRSLFSWRRYCLLWPSEKQKLFLNMWAWPIFHISVCLVFLFFFFLALRTFKQLCRLANMKRKKQPFGNCNSNAYLKYEKFC